MKLTQSLLTLLASSSAAVVVLASPVADFDTSVINKHIAPLLSSMTASEHEIPNSYIVVFKKQVSEERATQHHAWVANVHQDDVFTLKKRNYANAGGLLTSEFEDVDILSGVKHTYNIGGSMMGYSGIFSDNTLQQIRAHPDVEYVEKDSNVHTLELEKMAPWGLARISHRKALSFATFNQYLYAADGGAGVDAYVIDTGTYIHHVDFEGRARWGKTIPENDEDVDGNGHGTHCSGTIAGKKYGVAKKANVIAVKVLKSNGSGTMSDVVKGVEWAVNAHLKKVKESSDKKFKGSVANMSLGGGKSKALDLAVNAAVEHGMHFAVAAGNDNNDACRYSPAAAENPVTVGASTLGDERAYFSNTGKCVDIFGPGLNIQSTWIGSKHAVNTISGTSMASPHIAGLLAYYLSLIPDKDSSFAVSEMTPAELKKMIIAVSSVNMLSGIPADTPNLLAWNGGGKSNYTEILEEGRYVNREAKDTKSEVISENAEFLVKIEKIEKALEKEIKDEIKSIFDSFKNNAF